MSGFQKKTRLAAFPPTFFFLFILCTRIWKRTCLLEIFILADSSQCCSKWKVGLNYSGSVGSHYPKSIPGACCVMRPLFLDERHYVFLFFFFYSYNVCVFRECGPIELPLCRGYTEHPCTTVLLVVQLQPAGGKHICLTDPKGLSS